MSLKESRKVTHSKDLPLYFGPIRRCYCRYTKKEGSTVWKWLVWGDVVEVQKSEGTKTGGKQSQALLRGSSPSSDNLKAKKRQGGASGRSEDLRGEEVANGWGWQMCRLIGRRGGQLWKTLSLCELKGKQAYFRVKNRVAPDRNYYQSLTFDCVF